MNLTGIIVPLVSPIAADGGVDLDGVAANAERVSRARTVVTEALNRDQIDLATLSVALRVLRGVSTPT